MLYSCYPNLIHALVSVSLLCRSLKKCYKWIPCGTTDINLHIMHLKPKQFQCSFQNCPNLCVSIALGGEGRNTHSEENGKILCAVGRMDSTVLVLLPQHPLRDKIRILRLPLRSPFAHVLLTRPSPFALTSQRSVSLVSFAALRMSPAWAHF